MKQSISNSQKVQKQTQSPTTPTTYEPQYHLQRKNPLGKYQRILTFFVLIVIYQCPLIFSVALISYSILTLDIFWCSIFILITIAQYPISKCQWYIKFVNQKINPILYFKSFKRIFQEPISQEQNKCMFSFHPHAVFSFGFLANMNYHNDPLSRMVGLSSRFMLNMPITGLLLRIWGVQSVNAQNLKRLMKNGQNVGLVPGGYQQATLTTKKQFRVYIQNRKGFIKYALKYNYTIYPTIVLNEHQAFSTFDHLLNLRMWINKLKMPAVIYFNPKSLMFSPWDIDFITVVGKGLKGRTYSEDEQPTLQEIEDMHKKYILQIKRMYNKHKDKNGDKPLVMY